MFSHQEAVERDCATQYVFGDLPEPERDLFEEHMFDCPECSDRVKTGYLIVRGAEATWKRPIGAAAQPAPVSIQAPRRSWTLQALPYAAMLLLSLGAGVQYVALQKARAPRAVVAFAIPPQTRGDARQIQLPRRDEFVELELDLLTPQPQYHWEIRPAGRAAALMSGEARVPESASALRVLLPARKLTPGRYTATLGPAGGHQDVYPFEIVAGSAD